MSERMQEILDEAIAKNEFIEKLVARWAVKPWPEQFQILQAYMNTYDTPFDSFCEDVILHTLKHPAIERMLQDAYYKLAASEYERMAVQAKKD